VELINSILKKNINPILHSARVGDVRHSRADISKAQNRLNYQVAVDFETGLKRTIEWYLENGGLK
jgi:UDP-N-acetylglucosamine 4-epimerase